MQNYGHSVGGLVNTMPNLQPCMLQELVWQGVKTTISTQAITIIRGKYKECIRDIPLLSAEHCVAVIITHESRCFRSRFHLNCAVKLKSLGSKNLN